MGECNEWEGVLWIDTDQRRIGFDNHAEALAGQWDAAFLASLAPPNGQGEAPELDASAMAAALANYGLARAMTPTDWGRILDRLTAKLNSLTAGGPASARILFAPRRKTGGPWRLVSTVPVRSIRPAAVPPTPPRPSSSDRTVDMPGTPWLMLSDSDDPYRAVQLADRLKRAVEALWKAMPDEAIALLNDESAWTQESLALGLLRRLRLAEALGSVGRHEEARAVLARDEAQLRQPGLGAIFQPHASLTGLRLDYGASPVSHYAAVHTRLARDLASYWNSGTSRVDATTWAEHLHLAALCQRRQLEQDADATPDGGRAAVRAMLHSFHAAFLLFMLVRNYERAQHVCANLAYAHHKLALQFGEPHWTLAVDWHGLSFAMHATFGGAESSAWEYIYIGELWLSSAAAQEAFRSRMLRAGWNDLTPDKARFYEEACRIARQLGDPRQQAYTLLNRYRFQLTVHTPLLRQAALQELLGFLASHPTQHQLLQQEGYPLPQLVPAPVD